MSDPRPSVHRARGVRFLTVCLIAGVAAACDQEPPAPNDPGRASAPVRTAKVVRRSIPAYEEVVGTVRPLYRASVSAKITGRILQALVDPGARVEKDQLLAALEVGDLRASRDRAQADLDNAQGDWERYRDLEPGQVVSKSEIDRAEAAYRMATASLEEIERRLEYAEIKAPFAGVITRRLLDAGNLATPGAPIFDLEDLAHLRLEIGVPESVAGSIALKQELSVRIDGADLSLEVPVGEIAPAADPDSRTFLVKLDLPEHEALRSGQFGRAFLPRGEKQSLFVPRGAVVSRGQLQVVYAADDQRAVMRLIRTGQENGDEIEVLSGLEEGEIVVVDPPADLRGGQTLEFER